MNPEAIPVVSAAESVADVEAEPEDISSVDGALIQDRFDDLGFDPTSVVPSAVPSKPLIEAPEKLRKEAPKAGVPSLDEWQDFIGRFFLRTVTDGYLSLALRDIEEDLTPREREMIQLTKEDLKEMSAPLASLAAKSKLGKRHGRNLIAAADSYESVIALVIWMRRVNKIAKKYRKARAPRQPQTVIQTQPMEGQPDGNPGTYAGQGPEQYGYIGTGPGFVQHYSGS